MTNNTRGEKKSVHRIADAQDLIVALKLPLTLAETLNESVREKFRELWESAQGNVSEQEI